MDRFFELSPFAALVGIGVVTAGRAAMLNLRGVRVVVIDPQRTATEQAFDLIVVLLAALWAYLVFEIAWPPGPAWLPAAMQHRLPLATPIRALGAAALLGGVAIYATAVMHLGHAWRMGMDRGESPSGAPAEGPRLITAGIYSWSRNPIYLAFDLIVLGAFAVQPYAALLLLALTLCALLHLQVIREERFLVQRFGRQFEQYQQSVGRYIPWF